MKISFEEQLPGNLADPAWGLVLRFRPFQFGILLGLRAIMLEARS